MSSEDLETLARLLLALHEEAAGNGSLRDDISFVRHYVVELLDELEAEGDDA